MEKSNPVPFGTRVNTRKHDVCLDMRNLADIIASEVLSLDMEVGLVL